ncbi:MAG: BrnA antitoxin family protein [Gemmatimonadota bacterium]|nr:BrnA antitoxin family protein [Gemmatimonadota bacterium]
MEWSEARPVVLANLQPWTKTISLRSVWRPSARAAW